MKLICFVFMVLMARIGCGQNLVNNGDFDTDINHWNNVFVTSSWDGVTAGSISGPGSMRVEGSGNNNASFYMESNDFPVNEGYLYWFSAGFNPPSPSPVPRGWSTILWFDGLGAQIPDSQDLSSVFGVPNDSWTYFEGHFTAPAGAVTGQLRVYLQSGEPGDLETPVGLWDDVVVMAENLFVSGFE